DDVVGVGQVLGDGADEAAGAVDIVHPSLGDLAVPDAGLLALSDGQLDAGPEGNALAVAVDRGLRDGAVHTHPQPVHNQAVLVEHVLPNPIDQLACQVEAPGAGRHDRDRTVGGDVIEGLVAAPRQHARERVHSLENVLLQVLAGGGALDLGVLLRTPHGQREPGLVVVVVIPRQRREVAQSHAAQRGPQLALAGLGWATAYGVHLAVHVVGLPPVVPAVKSLVPSQGWPGYHCKIGPRHAPYFR